MGDGEIDRVRQLVARRCVDTRIPYAKLSSLIGKNSTYVQQWIKDGSPRNLSDSDLALIASALDINEADLHYRIGEYRMPSKRSQRVSKRKATAVGFPTDRRAGLRAYKQYFNQADLLPVHKVFLTYNHDEMVSCLTPEPVSKIAMPEPLMGVPGAFAFMASHDLAHVPLLHSGDVVLVNSVLPPRADDIVVLRRTIGNNIEIIVRCVRGADQTVLKVVPPKPLPKTRSKWLKEETIQRTDWADVGVVVGLYLRR